MIEVLPWDSEFFGFRIGRLRAEALTPAVARSARQWCRANDVSCLYFLGPADPVDPPEGFQLVDRRVTFRWETRPVEQSTPAIRPFQPGDLAALEAIARCSHRNSRFYKDRRFDRKRCDDLYATWIRRSCSNDGWADAVFVAEHEHQPVGYVTCVGNSIGLIGVAEQAQGFGLGTQLVHAAQRRFCLLGVSDVEVVTQGCNQAAHRLYLRCGFRVASIEHWHHFHV